MVEDKHRRQLSGSSRTPSVKVDAIKEEMVLAVIAGAETGDNWCSMPFLGWGRPRRGKRASSSRFQDGDEENCCLI